MIVGEYLNSSNRHKYLKYCQLLSHKIKCILCIRYSFLTASQS